MKPKKGRRRIVYRTQEGHSLISGHGLDPHDRLTEGGKKDIVAPKETVAISEKDISRQKTKRENVRGEKERR